MADQSGFKKFTEKYAGIWQFIKFTLVSSIAGASEFLTFLILNRWLLSSLNDQVFDWFIFHYTGGNAGGLGSMIAFLISSAIGNTISFIINRKATFHANNNMVLSVSLYIILIVTLICLQTYIGPLFTDWLNRYIANANICGILSKAAMMFGTFLIVFPMNKFIIMRNSDKKVS